MKKIRQLPPLPSIQELIRLYRLRARKQMSQNFLLDLNLTNKIVRTAGKLQDAFVCEVGPGPGGITRSILNTTAKHLVVVEKDRRFLPSLQLLAEVSDDRMRIKQGDILQFNLADVIPEGYAQPWEAAPPNIHIIGNLPFSVSTPLIIKWLEDMSNQTGPWKFGRTQLTLTFQKEVAERMVAATNTSNRCRLSIMCQYLCDVQLKFTIPGKAFVPPPKVDVGVVQFVPLVEPRIKLPFKLVEKLNRHLFHYRNKHIKHGIRTLFPPDMPSLTEEMFEVSGLDPQKRSYMVKIEEIKLLCHAYKNICDRVPGVFEYDYRTSQNALMWRKMKTVEEEYIEEQLLQQTTRTDHKAEDNAQINTS